MLEKLNITVKYSALYRPQAIGMLERQHQTLKNSLKAVLEEMGDKHGEEWLNHLPLVLLGRRVALQSDLGCSASELTFGVNPRIPGQILYNPEEIDSVQGPRSRTSYRISEERLPEKQFNLQDIVNQRSLCQAYLRE